MSVRVHMPPVLRVVTGGERWLTADGACVGHVLNDLAARHPALGLHFFDEEGRIRRNIVFLHRGDAVRANEAADRPLGDNDELVITNALAGG